MQSKSVSRENNESVNKWRKLGDERLNARHVLLALLLPLASQARDDKPLANRAEPPVLSPLPCLHPFAPGLTQQARATTVPNRKPENHHAPVVLSPGKYPFPTLLKGGNSCRRIGKD